MAIIDILNEIRIWGQRWCQANNKVYSSSGYSNIAPGNVLSNYNMYIPDAAVTTPLQNSSYNRGVVQNAGSQPLTKTVTFNVTTTDEQSNSTTHGITAGTSVTAKTSANIFCNYSATFWCLFLILLVSYASHL
ncbi:hypothetical protein FOA24_37310 [Bacillus thuringiensis]|uniref:hypothetical protein n=1 Tax=Bacillus thuringiensis TaxID=1428 RepID=UPI00333DB9AE